MKAKIYYGLALALAVGAGLGLIIICGIGIRSCLKEDDLRMNKYFEYRDQLRKSGVICLSNPWSDSHDFIPLSAGKVICRRCGLVKP